MYTIAAKLYLLLLIFSLLMTSCTAQSNCQFKLYNYDKETASKLKKSLPCNDWSDKVIMKVESSFDINNDGLLDLIVRHLDTLKNGTSQSVSLYLADSSSEYRLRNSYNNIVPNYYEHYSLEHLRLTDSIAYKTYPYVDGNPLSKLIFLKNQVHFTLKPFSDERFDFVYTYDSSTNDYIFYSGKYTVEQSGSKELFEVPVPTKGNSLKQFTITDYYYYEP